jgi:Glycosyl hydrolases family 35/Beta-galactosidase, domain 2/Beta-galactosidase, galactose-binding domain
MSSSRRAFLKSSLLAPLAASLCPSGSLIEAYALAPPQMEFDNPQIIKYDAHCFTIYRSDIFVRSGSFHYSRCPKALWRDRLTRFRRAGFNAIETYVFWNYHEPEKGKTDLSEFEDFVKLVHEMGLYMIARPGPYVCAEWHRGGFPDWVAAMRFPLRGNDPQSIETSQYWYNQVLPIIQRHQIVVGGPIIMMQIENEYDYCPHVSDADKHAYIRALEQMAWNAGIAIPLITCWTKAARENSDPDMAKVMDTCNFYPRWNIEKEVPGQLKKLRAEEPFSPVSVTELQGGWFSSNGGKLSVDQEGINAQQLNMLTKTVIEQGLTFFNYYMGFGGTNFDWAAKFLTTTYDYAAPIREPGGLWDKYYTARGICGFLQLYGDSILTRAEAETRNVQSSNPNVSISQRTSGKSAVVFVRENANADQQCKLTFVDPNSPTHRPITVPRQGELRLKARDMKMFPVQVQITGGQLRYSTAEILTHGTLLDRDFLILYDDPGNLVEFGLATENEPKVEGPAAYQYWDNDYQSVVIGARMGENESIFNVNGSLLVVLAPRQLALRTFVAEIPLAMFPGVEGDRPVQTPYFTNAYMMAGYGRQKDHSWTDLDFPPGKHDMRVMLPQAPEKCRVDGEVAEFRFDRPARSLYLTVTVPAIPVEPVTLSSGKAWVEKFDVAQGHWDSEPLRALEDFGPDPYGYVKFRAEFNHAGEKRMFLSALADDSKKVFINGQLVPDLSNAKKQADCDLTQFAKSGNNLLEISYESFGAFNGGTQMGDLKGVDSVKIGDARDSAHAITGLQLQRLSVPMRGRTIDPNLDTSRWNSVDFSYSVGEKTPVPAFTWCQTEFRLSDPVPDWQIPWNLEFESACDGLIFVNGKFLGRFVTVGPQKEFYIPDPYLNFGPKESNTLTFVLAYTGEAGRMKTLRLAPYPEFSVKRTHIEFEW